MISCDSIVLRDEAVIEVAVVCVTSTESEDSWSCSVSEVLTVLHRLPPAGHVEPVSSDSALSAAIRRNSNELYTVHPAYSKLYTVHPAYSKLYTVHPAYSKLAYKQFRL